MAADERPRRPDELLRVPGFGPAKVGRYGEELVALLQAMDG
jgi:HRDC domain